MIWIILHSSNEILKIIEIWDIKHSIYFSWLYSRISRDILMTSLIAESMMSFQNTDAIGCAWTHSTFPFTILFIWRLVSHYREKIVLIKPSIKQTIHNFIYVYIFIAADRNSFFRTKNAFWITLIKYQYRISVNLGRTKLDFF